MSVLGAPFPPLSEGLVFVLQQSPLWLPVSLRKVGNRSSLLQHTPISKNPLRLQPRGSFTCVSCFFPPNVIHYSDQFGWHC